MNWDRARRMAAAALLALLLPAGPMAAEVKLRIYLQDGALQAGTLVTETPKSFVILTNEGRVEVPKSSIMFINGKTLKQWQDRPDKLFQTEIMPSDVPDPAFVNDKSLPPPPPVPAMPVSVTPAPVAKAPTSNHAATAVEEKKPVDPTTEPSPIVVKNPTEKKTTTAPAQETKTAARPRPETPAEPPHVAARREHRAARHSAATVASHPSTVAAATAPSTSPEPSPESLIVLKSGPGRFDRAAAGIFHRERGGLFARQGEKGRAVEEYEIARLMEPGNPENPLQLARLALDRGQLREARRYFSNPSLRHNAEAKDQIRKIGAELAARDESVYRLRAATMAASFAWLPIIVLLRLFRRRRGAAPRTISADDLAPAAELASPVSAARVSPVEVEPPAPSFEETVEMALADLPMPPAPVEAEPEPTPEPAASTEEPAMAPEVAEPAIPEPAAPEPVAEAAAEPVYDAPVEEPPTAPPPTPEPVFAAPVRRSIPIPDPEEILSVARTVEVELMRGNQGALEGRLEDARRAYRTALALSASCASAHLGLGYVAFAEEKWEIALLHYRKALEIDTSSADAHYGVARVLLEINRVEDALPELRATLQLDPTYDDARDTLTALSKPA